MSNVDVAMRGFPYYHFSFMSTFSSSWINYFFWIKSLLSKWYFWDKYVISIQNSAKIFKQGFWKSPLYLLDRQGGRRPKMRLLKIGRGPVGALATYLKVLAAAVLWTNPIYSIGLNLQRKVALSTYSILTLPNWLFSTGATLCIFWR